MAAARRGTFAFDLSQPKKKGMLLKQGLYHRAFKTRFFVLYPGFLVYYAEESKWRLDITRGETLQSRQGAIKLKNGTVNICRQAPKGVKFGIIVHGPDPQNKRPTYLLNATSKDDRDMWIEAIKNNIPVSPKLARKDDAKPKDSVTSTKEAELIPPKYTSRQDTVDTAAIVAAEAAQDDSCKQLVTSIDQELLDPSISVRRDTSNIAALSLSNKADSSMDQLLEDEPETNINDILGITDSNSSTDDEDVSNGTASISSEPEEPKLETLETTDSAPVAQDLESNTKSNSDPMDTQESISTSVNVNGDVEVTISISVECGSNCESSETGGNERVEDTTHLPCNEEIPSNNEKPQKISDNEATNSEGNEQNVNFEHDKKDSLTSESSEVFVSKDERSNSFSVSMVDSSQNDMDSNDESEDENNTFSTPPRAESPQENGSLSNELQENGSLSKELQENGSLSNKPQENGSLSKELQENGSLSNKLQENGSLSNEPQKNGSLSNKPQENASLSKEFQENGSLSNKLQENGSLSNEPQENSSLSNGHLTESRSTESASPITPSITIDTVEKVEHSGSEHSSGDEGAKLPPPSRQGRRRSSAPFIQKVGYLYKMGGHYKNWKLRYFILNPGAFNYFKNPQSKQPLGEVKLKNINIYFPAAGQRKTSYQFCLHTESTWNKRAEWVMAAQSEREMKEWISAFKLAGQKSLSPSSSPVESDEDDTV